MSSKNANYEVKNEYVNEERRCENVEESHKLRNLS